MSATANDYLARLLEPVAQCLTPDVAKQLVRLRPHPSVQARIEELAATANEGALLPDEAAEYHDYIEACDLIGILQAMARALLTRSASG
jgi:hypothetical protein